MINNNARVDEREQTVLDFINTKKDELKKNEQQTALMNTPAYKMNVLNSERKNATGCCLDTIFAKLYKDALPFEDPKKNCSLGDMRDEIHDFIQQRSCGKGTEWYVREAIKKNNSPVLKKVLQESVDLVNDYYREKAKDIGKISIQDLNFNMNADSGDLDKITKKLEFDEVAEIIHDNVQKAIQDESIKAKREDEYNDEIENDLMNDVTVQDETSMESAIAKKSPVIMPTVYQPSLFEAVLLHCASNNKEDAGPEIMSEAVHEYTKLNIIKSLRLEKFDLPGIKKLANTYASAI